MTNFMKTTLLIFLFLLTSSLIIFTPHFKQAVLAFSGHFPLIKEQGVRVILSTSPAIQSAVQELASKAILLYLTFALTVFLIFSFKVESRLAKRISITLVTLLISGIIGFIWQPYEAPVASYEVTKKRSDISLNPGDTLEVLIHFRHFQKDFKVLLEKALMGEVRVFIQPYFAGDFDHTVTIGDQRFPNSRGYRKINISPAALKNFLDSKEISVHSTALGERPFALRVRDLNKPSLARQDHLTLNGKRLDLKGDSLLLLFSFEALDRTPIIAFY